MKLSGLTVRVVGGLIYGRYVVMHIFVDAIMMINHSTLDCHVTFSTRSLAGPERRFETPTLLSDPNPNPNPIPNKSIC